MELERDTDDPDASLPPPLQSLQSSEELESKKINAIIDSPEGAQALPVNQEERVKELEKSIMELHQDFGAKRAQFKDMYLLKEEELEKEREMKNKLSLEIKKLQDELNEAKSEVTIAEFQKEEELEREKVKHQNDLTSMRMRYEESIMSIKAKYDGDVQQLKQTNQRLESDLNDVKMHLLSASGNADVGPGAVFSAVTKTLARKLNSTMTASSDSLQEIEDPSKSKHGKYAQEDAESLRSLVVQLEEEISALKVKLRHSDDQLATVQGAQASLVTGNDALTVLLQGEDVQGVLTQFDDKLREARCGLQAEKSSRADLEMYVAFANAQKTLLQEELDKVKTQLRELRCSYEMERKRHEELKETWEKANDHFVTTQNEYLGTIDHYQKFMSHEQLESLRSNSDGHVLPVLSSNTVLTNPIPPTSTETKPNPPDLVNNCQECKKNEGYTEKLRSDLHKAAKLRNEMEEEWSRISHEFQSKMGSLEEEIGTYEVVLLELNTSCQQSMEEMENQIKRLSYERESIQKKIEILESENDNLKGKHVAHSNMLQNEYISLPNDIMELQEMVLRLKEDLINVKVGKEQIEGELKFLKDQMQMIEEERTTVEENLNAEISDYRDKLHDKIGHLHRQEEEKKKLEKTIGELKNRLLSSETQLGKLHHIKKHNQELIKEKELLQGELQETNAKVTTLRKELTNSEELQKDLIALSKSLQVNLENIRQAETEVRWQHPDDISSCTTCRKSLPDSKEKHHCKHCGRIFCCACVSRSVRRGNRDYNVCGVCHTLLAHDSAPYFSTEPPHSPD